MERRGCGAGCIVAWLGLLLSGCILPYLISSIYSVVSYLLQTPTASARLWRGWLRTVVEVDNPLYLILAEGPMCCTGIVALLIVVLGAVMMIGGLSGRGGGYEEEEYEPFEPA